MPPEVVGREGRSKEGRPRAIGHVNGDRESVPGLPISTLTLREPPGGQDSC